MNKKIGIIGGGQLGKMMILEAKKMGFYVAVLDPAQSCPASSICDYLITAGFKDKEAIKRLASLTDVVTYELEHIDSDVLIELENSGVKVYPTAKSLINIQNKFTQKTMLKNAGIPVPDFLPVGSIGDFEAAARAFGYPFVLKTCYGGYDGKGNSVVRGDETPDKELSVFSTGAQLMAERFVPFIKEISVLACRDLNGNTRVYSVAENIHNNNILYKTLVPARISQRDSETAMRLAEQVMAVFDGVGMFCVEMFLEENGNVLINEVAPRPHNSGHYTIEGCVTSQFEQHIRAVVGLPLGDTALLRPSVMINILGEPDSTGSAVVSGLHEALAIPGCNVHFYGKEVSVPGRKMGHLTVTADTLEEADALAEQAKCLVKTLGV